jgi:septal ring factor EnvC (AmiA/AmiB activator)
MLRAVRTSILLGAVVPELHSEAEALASDLSDLVRVRAKITAEKTQLAASVSDLDAERTKLTGLVAARTKAQSEAEAALAAETAHEQDLAKQASDLKDLIARMESAETGQDAADGEGEAAALRQSARLSPAVAFADARGSLHLPVSGAVLKDWGAPDGYGGTEKGDSIATRPGAIVAAPADARVAFAGPYRSYGQLLILNAGGGYHIVLAGMDRINVSVGQFVLAGEPVGAMGDGSARTAAAIAIGAAQPVLYVEFRKDGAAIDPAPWWAKPEMEKARG